MFVLSAPLLDVLASLRVSDLEKEVKELKHADLSTTLSASIRSEIPSAVNEYLRSSMGDALQKEPEKQALFDSMHESKSFNKHPANKTLYHALIESLIADENAMDQGVTNLIKHKKRPHDNDDRDQDPLAGPDQELKKIKTSKDVEPSKKPKQLVFLKILLCLSQNQLDWFKKPVRPPTPDPEWNTRKLVDDRPAQNWLNDLANSKKPPLSFDDLMSTLIDFSGFAMNRLKISKLTKANLLGLVYNLLKGACKRITLKENVVPMTLVNLYLCTNLRGGSTDRKYTASTTKTKATKYKIEGIKDMVPNSWSPTKVAYDKVSRHDVYSTMRILSVTSVTVDKWYVYGYLNEIVVRRAYQKLYKFMEGNFLRLHLNDIEYMLLLVVQNRLNNLEGDKGVEDLQLGVKSYQKKLNISKPRTRDVDPSRRALYTTLLEPQGVIYEDKLKRKRLMRTEELYKFSDGTLTSVRNTLDKMLKNLRLGYNKAMERRK
ncbi:hypothetical protein Tco_0837242 [Tanacetum coccineum]